MRARSGQIRLFAMDVDGTLTDGSLLIGPDGAEFKAFHSHDGLGIKLLPQAGIVPAIVSGRRSPATDRRATELGIGEVHQAVDDKRACLEALARRHGLALSEVAFMGDDLGDLPAMRAAGFCAAPADAAPEVRAAADYVARHPGGRGAVRDAIEHLLRAQGQWQEILAAHAADPERP